MDRRAYRILRLAVETYIAEARPVSSAEVARRGKDLHLSSASIRAVMAELERQGLLHQPHTSAGRIPTDAGLRVYLDGLMDPKLHPWDRKSLDAAVNQGDVSQFPVQLGQVLAGLSGQMTAVAVPRFLGAVFREVGLIRLGPGRFVTFFLSPSGLVQQKLVQVDFDVQPAELVRMQNFLNGYLAGRTLEEVRRLIHEELGRERVEYDLLRLQALEMGREALPEPEALQLYVEGTSYLASQPEFADIDKLKTLLRAVEEKTVLLRLLDRMLDGSGVKVLLGSEHHLCEIAELACVGSSWLAGQSGGAAISVLGPTRMNYGRLVPLVGYATTLLVRYWAKL